MKLTELKQNKRNPRGISPAAIDKLAESIERDPQFMVLRPIVVDEGNNILGGNQRFRALQKLGRTEIPDSWVVKSKDLTPEQKRRFILVDNAPEGMAGYWDFVILQEEYQLPELEELGFDLEDFGDIEPNVHGLTDPDDVPEVQEEPVTKSGDIWLLGNHRLMCGDSTVTTDVEKLMGQVKSICMVADPPYGINVIKKDSIGGGGPVGGKKNYKQTIGGDNIVKAGKYNPIINDDKPFNPDILFIVKGDKIIFGANYFAQKLPQSRGWFCWDKIDGMEGTTKNFSDIELGWTNFDKPARIFRHRWQGLMKASEKNERRCHPTQKPIQLIIELMEYYSPEMKEIYDPFVGSGTTIIAAEMTGRSCYAMEIDPHYCDVAIRRWENFTGKKAKLEIATQIPLDKLPTPH